MEHVFDQVCRCFGGVPATATSARREAARSNPSSPNKRKGASPEIKRRTSRLELQDKEWDGLFQQEQKQTKSSTNTSKPLQYHHNPDLEYARAVAEAKLAGANPTRRSSPPTKKKKPTNKRKSPATKRDEIFRTRRFEPSNMRNPTSCSSPQHQPNSSNHISRLLHQHPSVANALCFANPVRDDEDDLPLNEVDDDSTLNTCEDTITSTVYFDAKYAHVVEKRPPMPLFSHFKVTEEEDHIRRIVATDSHNSLNMMRLMNEQPQDHSLPESSSSSEDDEVVPPPPKIDRTNVLQHSLPPRRRPTTPVELPPEPVKINSSGSSKSTASTTPSSSSPPFPDEGGRVVRL